MLRCPSALGRKDTSCEPNARVFLHRRCVYSFLDVPQINRDTSKFPRVYLARWFINSLVSDYHRSKSDHLKLLSSTIFNFIINKRLLVMLYVLNNFLTEFGTDMTQYFIYTIHFMRNFSEFLCHMIVYVKSDISFIISPLTFLLKLNICQRVSSFLSLKRFRSLLFFFFVPYVITCRDVVSYSASTFLWSALI